MHITFIFKTASPVRAPLNKPFDSGCRELFNLCPSGESFEEYSYRSCEEDEKPPLGFHEECIGLQFDTKEACDTLENSF